jgi:copper chaperone CopZ
MILQRLKLSIIFSSNLTFSTIEKTALEALCKRNSSAMFSRMPVYSQIAMHCTASFGSRPGFIPARGVGIAPGLETPLLAPLPHRKFNRLPTFHIYASMSTATTEKEASEVEEGTQAAATPVVLTVRGMKCGGCSAAVKRMLLQHPGVSSAAVNLLTETAVIQVVSEAPAEVAEEAAGVLGSKGFPAELRKADEDDIANAATAINERKAEELKES